MTYQQLVKPRTWIIERAGLCHKLARRVFKVKSVAGLDSAWKAWQAAPGRHTSSHPRNVAVPIWFSHWGTYGRPARYDNWGHVVVYIPGRGYLSSPGRGIGRKWFKTIAAVEAYFTAKYVGWSEGINGVRLVKSKPKPAPIQRQEHEVLLARYQHAAGKNKVRWAFFGPGFWMEVKENASAVKFKAQLGMTERSFEVTEAAQWNLFKASAQAGMSEPGLKALLEAITEDDSIESEL